MVRQVYVDTRGVCTPNPGGQAGFINDWRHKYVALAGGWGAGKTWAGARKLLQLHIWNALRPIVFDDGQAGYVKTFVPSAIIAPTYRNLWDFDIPMITQACDQVGLKYKLKPTDMEVHILKLGTFEHPSVIMLRTADAPERIAGWQVGAAWGDEATRWKEDRHTPKKDPFIQLLGRVRHPDARIIRTVFTFTHEGDSTRMYEAFHDGDPDEYAIYVAPTKENPVMRSFYTAQMKNLPKDLRDQYLEGKALSVRGGKAYGEFDYDTHVDEKLILRPGRPIHIALDFNIDPGMFAEIGQYDAEDDVLSVVHEIHQPRLDVRELVKMIAQLFEEVLPDSILKLVRVAGDDPLVHVFGDASGNAEWAGTGESSYYILRTGLDQLGIPHRVRVPAANPRVVDRINAYRVAMKDGDGDVHWKCHPRCVHLIEDLKRMRTGADGSPLDKSEKRLSHASDAEGYRIEYLRPARISLQVLEAKGTGRMNVRAG